MNNEERPQDQDLAEHLRESQALLQISQMLARSMDLPTILRQIVDASVSLIPKAEQSVIHLVDEVNCLLRPVAVARPDSTSISSPIYFRSGEGIAGLVIATGKTINVNDTLEDQRFLQQDQGSTIYRSLLVAPIRMNEETIGTLSVESSTPGAFSLYFERLLTSLGEQAALAIERAQILQEEQEQRQLAEALREASNIQGSDTSLQAVLNHILVLIKKVLPYDTATIMMIENGHARVAHKVGNVNDSLRADSESSPIDYAIDRIPQLKSMVETGRPTIIHDTIEIAGWINDLNGARSWAGAPIHVNGQVIAFISLGNLQAGFYEPKHADWLTAFAAQASLTIEKAMIYDDLQKTLTKEQAARAQLVQSEKLAALGRIVASVAHELNNPLQAIQNALYLINMDENLNDQAREDIQVALNEANRMADLISRLRETYRPTTREEFQRCSVNLLVTEVEKLISAHLRRNEMKFIFIPDQTLPECLIIQDQIKQVILNISLNAVESMSRGGTLTIQTYHETEQNQVRLDFIDTGSGIAPDVLPNIFDPFVTTKDRGTGLGLAITYDIVRRHGGRIEPESKVGRGTIFHVWLPIEAQSIPFSDGLH